MTDDEIDYFLKEINNSKNKIKIISLIVDDGKDLINEQTCIFQEMIYISFIKKDLKVINEILQEKSRKRRRLLLYRR